MSVHAFGHGWSKTLPAQRVVHRSVICTVASEWLMTTSYLQGLPSSQYPTPDVTELAEQTAFISTVISVDIFILAI